MSSVDLSVGLMSYHQRKHKTKGWLGQQMLKLLKRSSNFHVEKNIINETISKLSMEKN